MKEAMEKLKNAQTGPEVINLMVEEAVRLTNSNIGYFAIMNETEDVLTMLGWSKTAMDVCAIMDKPIVYPLVDTGLWGDCVRERKPVITNDYKNLVKPTKKGYPEDHVTVSRHMNVPMWSAGKIAGVLGVGNKAEPYSDVDAETLQEFAEKAWSVIEQVI
jgi:two-component system, OmpR family, phosphate regulon sensor histidine kinase PhoR